MMSLFTEDDLSTTGGGAGKATSLESEIESESEVKCEVKPKKSSKYDFDEESDTDETDCDCLICGDPYIENKDKNNDYIELKPCGHKFHYMCIFDYFKVILSKPNTDMATNVKRECPMCRTSAGLIPVKMEMYYIKGIHRAPRKLTKYITPATPSDIIMSQDPLQCKGMCKTGLQCKKKGKEENQGYCHLHKGQFTSG